MDNDWRLQAVTKLSEDWVSPWTGEAAKKGNKVTLVSVIKMSNKKNLVISLPNATAMCLNASAKNFEQAKRIREKNKIDTSLKSQVQFKTDADANDYLELMISSVIMAHTALEAFANEIIPDDYEYHTNKRSDIILEIYNKEKIERYISLGEKLSVILPHILGIPSPKGGSKCWVDFKKLKKLRDRLVHMKSLDRKSSGPDKETIWDSLIRAGVPHRQAKDVIYYFTKKMGKKPQWTKACPVK